MHAVRVVIGLEGSGRYGGSSGASGHLSYGRGRVVVVVVLYAMNAATVGRCGSGTRRGGGCGGRVVVVVEFSLFSYPFAFYAHEPFHCLPFPLCHDLLEV